MIGAIISFKSFRCMQRSSPTILFTKLTFFAYVLKYDFARFYSVICYPTCKRHKGRKRYGNHTHNHIGNCQVQNEEIRN